MNKVEKIKKIIEKEFSKESKNNNFKNKKDKLKKIKIALGVAGVSGLLALGGATLNKNNSLNNLNKTKKDIKDGVCEIIDCKDMDTKEKLLSNLNMLKKTENKDIINLLILLENNILDKENLSEEDFIFFKNSILELAKLDRVFDLYLNESLTQVTNQTIGNSIKKEVTNYIINDIDFTGISEYFLKKIEDDLILLNDNYFFQKDGPRDFIEKNINFDNYLFNGTNFETKKMEIFLNLFTIEYINKLGRKNFIDENGKILKINKEDLDLNKIEIREIISKVLSRAKDTNFDFEITFNSKNENIKINISEFKDLERINFPDNGIIFSNNPNIRQLQENYGVEHRNKSVFKEENGKNILEYGVQSRRVNPFLENSPKGSLQKTYFNKKEIEDGVSNGELIDLKNIERNYDIKNDIYAKNETFSTIDTKFFLDRISKRFFEETGYKFQVTSLSRTLETNESLSNATKNSSHLRGNGIDISISRVFDKNGKEKSINLKSNEIQILLEILKEEDLNYNSIHIIEGDHIHISVLSTFSQITNLKSSKISKNFLETKNEEKMSVSDYIDKNGFNISTKILIQDIFHKSEIDFARIPKDKQKIIYENTKNFIKYIIYIESSGGKYLENNISSAKGPFQIIDGYKSGKKHERYSGENNFTTFEVWLRKYIKYANNVNIPRLNMSLTPDFVEYSLKSKGEISPNELNQTQNINLFLVGTFLGNSKTEAENFVKVVALGDNLQMQELYIKHHTNPDEATKKRMEESIELFGPNLKSL